MVQFKVIYVPGRKHCGPDYMSRHGLNRSDEMASTKEVRISCIMGMIRAQEDCGNHDLDTYTDIEPGLVRCVTASLNMVEGLRAVTFDRVKKAVAEDESIKHHMTKTFPRSCVISTKSNMICTY